MKTLVVAPEMSLDEVVRSSNVELGVYAEPDGWAVAQPREMHATILEDADRGFTIPEGLFTVIEVHGGRVRRIVTTPQRSLLTLQDVTSLATTLDGTLERRGWKRTGAPLHEVLPSAREDDVIGSYVAGTWRADIALRKSVPPAPDWSDVTNADAAVWLLSLRIEGGPS